MIDRPIIIPGVQKAGTSTLYEVLRYHSDVVPCTYKEPQFLALPGNDVDNYLWWYRDLFPERRAGSAWLDASTFYLSSEWFIRNVRKHVKNARFVIVVRDPVQRAFSAYIHMKKKVPARDRRTFGQVVAAIERRVGAGADVWSAEDDALRKAARKGLIDTGYLNKDYHKRNFNAPFDSHFEDIFWPYRYFGESEYSRRIVRLESVFGSSSVLMTVFEDLVAEAQSKIATVLEFLDLPIHSETLSLPHINVTRVPGNAIGRNLIWLRENSRLAADVWERIRRLQAAQSLKGIAWKPKPMLSKATYERARQLLQDEYDFWPERFPHVRSVWTYPCKTTD